MPTAARHDVASLSIAALEESLTGRRDPMRVIAALSESDLAASLETDDARLAFWINVYDAGVQLHLRARPELYQRRTRFFARRGVVVAGQRLTFNAIEHGLLRRSLLAYSLGYLQNPLPSRFERRFRLHERDPRIHFALNCGARSCPRLNPYRPDDIDAALEVATGDYLRTESTYDTSDQQRDRPAAAALVPPRLRRAGRHPRTPPSPRRHPGCRKASTSLRRLRLVPESPHSMTRTGRRSP